MGWRECPTFGVQFTFFQTAFFVYLTSFNPFFGFALSVSLDSD